MSETTPILLLTRPRPASERFWAALPGELRAGLRCVISPLLEIRYAAEVPNLSGYDALIATSAQAIAALTDAAAPLPPGLPCYAVGDATAQAAQKAGLTAISADGDADTLVAMVAQQAAGQRVLHLHGTHTRGDVVAHLRALDVQAESVAVYDQHACPLGAEAKQALSGQAPVLVALFSPRTAALFAADYGGTAPLYVACMSAAVAHEIMALSPRRVETALRPTALDMAKVVGSLATDARMVEGNDGQL